VIFSEHFDENHMILMQQLQNDSALKFVQFFLDHSVFYLLVIPCFFLIFLSTKKTTLKLFLVHFSPFTVSIFIL